MTNETPESKIIVLDLGSKSRKKVKRLRREALLAESLGYWRCEP